MEKEEIKMDELKFQIMETSMEKRINENTTITARCIQSDIRIKITIPSLAVTKGHVKEELTKEYFKLIESDTMKIDVGDII